MDVGRPAVVQMRGGGNMYLQDGGVKTEMDGSATYWGGKINKL